MRVFKLQAHGIPSSVENLSNVKFLEVCLERGRDDICHHLGVCAKAKQRERDSRLSIPVRTVVVGRMKEEGKVSSQGSSFYKNESFSPWFEDPMLDFQFGRLEVEE